MGNLCSQGHSNEESTEISLSHENLKHSEDFTVTKFLRFSCQDKKP